MLPLLRRRKKFDFAKPAENNAGWEEDQNAKEPNNFVAFFDGLFAGRESQG
jgi:hypothetical protein